MDTSSQLRWYQSLVFGTLFLGYGCYTYNRKSVTYALPQLIEEGLEKSDAGLIISSSYLAYAISKFLGGILSDRVSARLLFSAGLAASGLATLLFALVPGSVPLYATCWFLNGLAQGCGWPACAKILIQWFAPDQFGTWWSLLSASSNLSGTVSPFFSASIILAFGWRTSLFVAGIISLFFGIAGLFVLVNCPQDVGLPSIGQTSKKSDKKGGTEDASVQDMLKSPFLWLVSYGYMVVFCAKTSAVDWGQLYLIEELGHSQYLGSSFNSAVELGGFVGGILAGSLTDWTVKVHRPRPGEFGSPRMKIALLMMLGCSACFHCLYFVIDSQSSVWLISPLGALLGACLFGPIAIFGVVASECAPKHLSGTAHAIVALAANIGAVTSGLPFSYLAKAYSWSAIFLLLEFLTLGTAFIMFFCRNFDCRIAKTKAE